MRTRILFTLRYRRRRGYAVCAFMGTKRRNGSAAVSTAGQPFYRARQRSQPRRLRSPSSALGMRTAYLDARFAAD